MSKAALRDGTQVRGETVLSRSISRILAHGGRAAMASSATALLLAAGESGAQQVLPSTADTNQGPSMAEINVTAQRRTQSLQDVPYNISAISGTALQDAGLTTIDGLTQVVPGLLNVDQGAAARGGNNNFILRGLRTDAPGGGSAGNVYQNLTVSPVSTYYGETPVFFKIPTDDLERVEVLRGPQGTLYGSGSQAGTIRFIPKRPTFDATSGEVSVDGGYTQYASSPNGSLHGVVNLPLAEHLALRVSAAEDHQGGFVDAVDRVQLDGNGVPVPSIPGNLESGFVLQGVQHGVNSSDQVFVRAALRWQPTEALDTQLEALHQHTSMADGQWGSGYTGGTFDPSFGFWPNASFNTRPGCNHCTTNYTREPYSDDFNLVDFVATVDVGLGTFTSSSSYSNDFSVTHFDQTGLYYGTPNPPSPASQFIQFYPYLNYPRLIAPIRSPTGNRSFVEEVRLASNPGKVFDYVVGLYYQHQVEEVNLLQWVPGIVAYDTYSGQPNPTTYGDNIYYFNRKTVFEDKAAFGELTWHATEAWQFTGGVRVFQQPFSSQVVGRLPLCGAICSFNQIDPTGLEPYSSSTSVSRHIWKANTSYDFTPTLKVYATFSEGFRRGGVSGLPFYGPFASEPYLKTFQPDFAKNYELGIKGSLFEHRINYFADIYLVKLDNFQFDGQNLAGDAGAFNGSTARSEGVEFETQMALTSQLSANLGYAYTKAYVSQSFTITDYLPYALIPSQGGTGQTTTLYGIPSGTPLPGVSRHIVNASIDYSASAGSLGGGGWAWKLHLDGSYRSAQNSNIDPTSIFDFTIPSAVIANARATLQASDRIGYTFSIRNLTNNPDITGGINDQRFSNPYRLRDIGLPRTYVFGLRYQF